MTDERAGAAAPAEFGPRTATIRSELPAAETVAAAIAPDDTADVRTRFEDGTVVAEIERPTTGSLEATVDDYVVALDVASTVARDADDVVGAAGGDGGDGATHGDGDTDGTGPEVQDANRHDDTTDT